MKRLLLGIGLFFAVSLLSGASGCNGSRIEVGNSENGEVNSVKVVGSSWVKRYQDGYVFRTYILLVEDKDTRVRFCIASNGDGISICKE